MVRKGLERLHALGLSFDAWMFYTQLPELVEVLRTLPHLNVILDHSGGLLRMPAGQGARSEEFALWKNNIREVAQFPNVSIKVGGLAMAHCGWDFHLRPVPADSAQLAAAWRPYVEACIETFGPGRCLMESNFPAEKISCGYGVLWNAMKTITRDCSAAEKALIYHDTAARVYRL
jgi:predicted TIM-barrel fold metal-dependent hydrolase